MKSFEYLVALVSIVAGMGLTRVLSGLAKIVHTGQDRRDSGVHIAWTGSVLLWLVAFWWFTFLLASIDTWRIPLLLFVLVYAAVIYFLIALLYPDNLETESDLLAYFLENRRWFFGTFIALGLLDLANLSEFQAFGAYDGFAHSTQRLEKQLSRRPFGPPRQRLTCSEPLPLIGGSHGIRIVYLQNTGSNRWVSGRSASRDFRCSNVSGFCLGGRAVDSGRV